MAYDADRPWPFLARGPELDVLMSVIAAGRGDPATPGGAVIVAPAGVGKTRLAREAIAWARGRGIPTLQVIGTRAAAHAPYAAIAPLLPVPAADADSAADAASRYRALEVVLPRDPRAVLLVDDAPLLDDASAALVLQLTLAGRITPLVTARRGMPVPDAVTVLWKDGLATRLDLLPFSAREIVALVSAGLQGPVATATGHRLAATVVGNPMYARELVRAAVASGALREVRGLWTWDGTVVVGDRLVDAVGRRLGELSVDDRAALVLLAVGEPLPVRLAERVVGAAALARVESAGVVHVDEGRYRLEHPLFTDVLLAQAGTAATRAAQRDLADAADELYPGRNVLHRVTWRMDGGGTSSPAQLLAAARLALAGYDAARAARFAGAVVARGEAAAVADPPEGASVPSGGAPLSGEGALVSRGRAPDDGRGAAPDAVTLAAARVLLAAACTQQSRFDEAVRQVFRAEDVVLREGGARLRREWMDVAVVALHQGLGRTDAADALLRRVERTTTASPADMRLARALRANLLFDAGRTAETIGLAGDVLAGGERDYAAVVAAMALGEAQAVVGLTSRARRSFEVIRRLGGGGAPRPGSAADYALMLEIMCRIVEGHVDSAEAEARSLYDALIRQHEHTMVGVAAMSLAAARMGQGRLRLAQRAAREAVDFLSRTDVEGMLAWGYSILAQIDALRGDVDDARTAQHRARELHHVPVPLRSRFDLAMADVRIRVAEGDLTGAGRLAAAVAADDGPDGLTGMLPARARMLYIAARLSGVGCVAAAARLREYARRCEGDFVGMLADAVAAIAAADAPVLVRLSAAFEERGMRMEARDAAADAARAYERAGRTTKAGRMRSRADQLSRQSRIPPWTASVPTIGGPADVLSRREREVAGLAAQGLSNAQIAARLVLSVRTVESHLYQAFGKLGVARREDLRRVLR